MIKFIKKEFQKPTIFFILGIISLLTLLFFVMILLITGGINLLILSRVLVLLFPILVLIILIYLDRFFLRIFDLAIINIVEFVLLILFFLIGLFF